MAVRENVTKVLKDLILPEFRVLRSEIGKLGTRLDAVENRLADFSERFQAIDARFQSMETRFLAIDQHLVDQSRRIDELRAELTVRLDHQNARIDQVIAQVAAVGQEVVALRHDREVVGDILRRVSRLEAAA
jgi:uncharacterized protein (DUF3084 family)